MDLLDAITSALSSPSRDRQRTPPEENARSVALYVLPVIVFFAVIAGLPAFVTVGVLPFLALGLVDAIGPRLGLDARRSRRLAFQSGWICLMAGSLGHFLEQSLF